MKRPASAVVLAPVAADLLRIERAVAANDLADPDLARHLTRRLNHAVPGLTDADAWPTLLNHLLLIDADDRDPFTRFALALEDAPLTDARDPAAVLLARLDHHPTGGPLPWLPGIPTRLTAHPTWGPYLQARRHLVTTLADQVRHQALTRPDLPAWAAESPWTPTAALLGDVEVWRALVERRDLDSLEDFGRAGDQQARNLLVALCVEGDRPDLLRRFSHAGWAAATFSLLRHFADGSGPIQLDAAGNPCTWDGTAARIGDI